MVYGTMGVGESEIGDPLSKIKIEGTSRLPKTGQEGKRSERSRKEDSKHKRSRKRSS